MEHRVSALVQFYRLVQTERMQGVPILNPALSVEAVGFQWGDDGQTVAEGDAQWQIPPGVEFADLPPHWTCPQCEGRPEQFMVMG